MKQKRIEAAWRVGIGAVFLAVMGLWAWVGFPESKPQTASTPTSTEFKLSIPSVNIFQLSDARKTGLLLDVVIRNGGVPSIAADWKLELSLAKGSHATAQSSAINPELRLDGKKIQQPVQLDALVLTQAVTSIPMQGNLLFYTDAPHNQVTNLDTVLILSVEDNEGIRFTNKQRIGDLLHL